MPNETNVSINGDTSWWPSTSFINTFATKFDIELTSFKYDCTAGKIITILSTITRDCTVSSHFKYCNI